MHGDGSKGKITGLETDFEPLQTTAEISEALSKVAPAVYEGEREDDPNAPKWHAPGMGEVHSSDHVHMIQCEKEIDDPDQDYVADDELAKKVCRAMNAMEQNADFGERVTDLVNRIRQPLSLAMRDSLVEELIELIDPTPGKEQVETGR